MVMKSRFILFLCLIFTFSINLYSNIKSIIINSEFENEDIELNKAYIINKNDTIKIETLKFYISNIELLNYDSTIFKEVNRYHLIDFSNSISKVINLEMLYQINYNKIRFNLGIDSIKNVSGVYGGDLDPTKGMYWTWQNGYINFKLEGMSNICKTRNNEFQFHLGGYQYPYNSIQVVELDLNNVNRVSIVLNLRKFFSNLEINKKNKTMSPSYESVKISKILATCFYSK